MSPWVLRGLRNGVVTTRWPARQRPVRERLARSGHRCGHRRSAARAAAGAEGLDALCPTGAISAQPDAGIQLDQGKCILCGRCVAARPDRFAWSRGPGAAALTRGGLVVPEIPETPGNLAAIRDGLRLQDRGAAPVSAPAACSTRDRTAPRNRRSRPCSGPVYDIHRLGIFITASPRHADVLLVTGAGARGMIGPLRRTFDGMPDPKLVIAVGTDAVSGGLISPSYATTGGVGEAVGVDAWLPGSPPSPFSILHALLLVLGRLPAREEAQR